MAWNTITTMTGDRHRSRYIRFCGGMSIEDIAKQDGVKPSMVKQSVDAVRLYRSQCTLANLETEQVGMLLELAHKEQKALENLLTAQKKVYNEKTGVLIDTVADTRANSDGIRLINEKLMALRPRGMPPQTNVNVAMGVGVGVTANSTTVGSSFEDVVRRLKRSRVQELEAAEDAPAILDGEAANEQNKVSG